MRERRYEHVLRAEGDRGISGKRTEEIVARTVDRARVRNETARMDKAQLELPAATEPTLEEPPEGCWSEAC